MASSVFYKFKSQKDESRVTFDGTGISIFDLKREIILANNLSKATDFDLYVYDATSNQEYKDDMHIVPRSSSVIVKRLPAPKPGKGKASYYVAGAQNSVPTSEATGRPGSGPNITWHKGAMTKRFDVKEEATQDSSTPVPAMMSSVTKDDEAAAMAAMFKAQTENWEETQEKMSHATRIYSNTRGTGFNRGGKPHSFHQPSDRPLPPSYVCYRCGQKGHWIHDCPTNHDRDFDNRPRIKRTTGIPRSMLKAIENPNSAELGQGIMVTPEGGYVVAQPDLASWQKQLSRVKGLTAAEVRERTPTDSSLACSIDNRLFRDAVKTPCCETTYCEECIQTHLLERDFICPNCSKKVASLDKLIVDQSTRRRVADYIDKTIEESKKEGKEEESSAVADEGQTSSTLEQNNAEQDFFDQNGLNMDMQQMIADSIPQLQAQISQISLMLQNPSLPAQVRQQTEMQHQQLQIQLQQAQTVVAALAAASTFQQQQQQQEQQQQMQEVAAVGMGFGNFPQNGGAWTNPYSNQQPPSQDSAYQRLPLNNRRRNLKRDRPSDFVEVGGENESKVPRYWE
ncbi:hypothetical protein M378DRAFT_70091 [Amanita muscaria Koide BX008]|uniref:DWNN-domain-containing protein n=1 Tax=Amanita muscaria (strain Koide BX008) TaxID=946122 RepID=A0A0C2TPW7_AMAMK|nr:hypothetical protein M378DRAFT_70091 [Amanita muscaria Koide BX008]